MRVVTKHVLVVHGCVPGPAAHRLLYACVESELGKAARGQELVHACEHVGAHEEGSDQASHEETAACGNQA